MIIFIVMGRPFIDKNRFLGSDGFWYYRCLKCDDWYEDFRMGKLASNPFGISSTCLYCIGQSYQTRAKGYTTVQSIGRTLTTKNLIYYSYEDTFIFLHKLGYDIEKNISEQFKEKIKNKYGVELDISKTHHEEKDPYIFKFEKTKEKMIQDIKNKF
jgi:hypothetical protein